MLPYFPLHDDTFKMAMGVQVLHDANFIEIDQASYRDELALKQTLLTDEYEQYYQSLPGTEPLQWEVIALLLPSMAQRYPEYFTLTIDGRGWTWHNRLLGQETHFIYEETESLPLPPLDWLGRQVQEDLLILDGNETSGMPLVAGQLCFPNAWCLDDKIGLSFLDIHQPVPLFASYLGRSSSLLLARLKAGRPVWRLNWSIKATSRLNLLPRFLAEEVQACHNLSLENVGERCFLRIERQTLSRLPKTNGILFTVRTYQASIAHVANTAEHARRIASVVRTMPHDVLIYKGMAPFAKLLLEFLERLNI